MEHATRIANGVASTVAARPKLFAAIGAILLLCLLSSKLLEYITSAVMLVVYVSLASHLFSFTYRRRHVILSWIVTQIAAATGKKLCYNAEWQLGGAIPASFEPQAAAVRSSAPPSSAPASPPSSSSSFSVWRPSVLITGGAMGIGLEMARQYAALGYDIIVWDVQEAQFPAVHRELELAAGPQKSRRLQTFDTKVVDVTSDGAVADAASDVLRSRGGLPPDVLILNAGIVNANSIVGSDLNMARVRRLFDVNLFHLFSTSAAFVDTMLSVAPPDRSSRSLQCSPHPSEVNVYDVASKFASRVVGLLPGFLRPTSYSWSRRIVIIGSVAGFAGAPRLSDYCSSKAAANCFAEALACEIRRHKENGNVIRAGKTPGPKIVVDVDVTLVCPYQVSTGMFTGCKTLTFFRELKPADVATAVVDAVRLRKNLLVIPWVLNGLHIVRGALSTTLLPWVVKLLGADRAMDQFVGRDPTAVS